MCSSRQLHTADFLKMIGVAPLPPSTSVFDPGYDAETLENHLEQSAHLISNPKISMACWLIANEAVAWRKVAVATRYRLTTTTGGGPFEIAVAQRQLNAYLDLCANLGVSRVECGEGFTEMRMPAPKVVNAARERNLEVQFELGKKHDGAFGASTVDALIDQGRRWQDAGAVELIIEARESARGVGPLDSQGSLHCAFADRIIKHFGFHDLTFEAPDKRSQLALLDHFGAAVRRSNVRLEELLRVEIYRRELHSDAFGKPNLKPQKPAHPAV